MLCYTIQYRCVFLKRGFDGFISCAAFLQQFKRWIYCEFNFFKKYLYFVNPEDEPLCSNSVIVHCFDYLMYNNSLNNIHSQVSKLLNSTIN